MFCKSFVLCNLANFKHKDKFIDETLITLIAVNWRDFSDYYKGIAYLMVKFHFLSRGNEIFSKFPGQFIQSPHMALVKWPSEFRRVNFKWCGISYNISFVKTIW